MIEIPDPPSGAEKARFRFVAAGRALLRKMAAAGLVRFAGWWSLFAGALALNSVCPVCGNAGCPTGIGSFGLIAAFLGLFVFVTIRLFRGGGGSRRLAKVLVRPLLRIRPRWAVRVVRAATQFEQEVALIMKRRGAFALALGVGILYSAAEVFQTWYVLGVLGHPSFVHPFVIYATIVVQGLVSILPGKGDLQLTGKLGEVMRESAHAALTWIRSRAERLGLDRHFYRELDVHVHVPEGATPKDGPSAGTAIALAMVSALTGVPTRHEIAMTGELTLRGSVIAVGGITEKTLAARRAGLETVLLPRSNEKDLGELPEDVREALEFVLVESMEQVLERSLERPVGTRVVAGTGPAADRPDEPAAAEPADAEPPEVAH